MRGEERENERSHKLSSATQQLIVEHLCHHATSAHAHTYVYADVCTHTHMHVHMHAHMHTHMHALAHMQTSNVQGNSTAHLAKTTRHVNHTQFRPRTHTTKAIKQLIHHTREHALPSVTHAAQHHTPKQASHSAVPT